eukprot:TRINITY_DN4236_c0_g3_i3.p1 TRINITY_DN4236_c0_g3~~TRINITY_DN4236_c0_g3_i3.p1  ORF type:complete len:503 (+),score=91.67 TRINITY_DN4236_c0_g3_i3:104-1612(+)
MPPKAKGGIVLDKRRYGVGITWTDVGKEVDMDLQAVIVDDRGRIVDAVYYNNLAAMNGAVQHSGDLSNSSETGEMIWVVLKKLPPRVQMIIFVLAAYNSNARLKDAMHGKINVCAEFQGQIIKTMTMEETDADVDAVAMMVKSPDGIWKLKQVDLRADSGQNFVDILEPTIGTLIRNNIEGAPAEQKVYFDTEKVKADHELDNRDTLRRLCFTVVGELADSLRRVDIDVSAVFYNAKGNHIGAVYCDNQTKFGVVHGGDSAKDEDLSIDLGALPEKVQQVFLLVHVFTEGRTFADLREVRATVTDQCLKDLSVIQVDPEVSERGLIVGRLNRKLDGAWGFELINRCCHGPTWNESLPETAHIFQKTAKQLRSDLEQAPGAPGMMLPRLSMRTVQTCDMSLSTNDGFDFRRMISSSFPIATGYASDIGMELFGLAAASRKSVMVGKRKTGVNFDPELKMAALRDNSSDSEPETAEPEAAIAEPEAAAEPKTICAREITPSVEL